VYKSSVVKQKPADRVVLVYNEHSDWHKDIDRSLFQLDHLQFGDRTFQNKKVSSEEI